MSIDDATPPLLGNAERQTAARNALVIATLVRATGLLRSTFIPSLPIKGGALLVSGVVRPEERHLDDLDLWVRPDQVRAAFDALVAAGFRSPAGPPSTTHAGDPSLDAPTHQLPVLLSPHGVLVELHLQSHAAGDAGAFDACYSAGVDVEVLGTTVRVPCALHLLEQVAAHVAVHHFGDLRYWRRHVNDVRRLVERAPELAALRGRPDGVGLSLRVARGSDVPDGADGWLAGFFLDPSPAAQAAWGLAAVLARSARFVRRDPAGVLRVLVPTSKHLRFTGDLVDGHRLTVAHLSRWRRITARAFGATAQGSGRPKAAVNAGASRAA